MHIKMRQNWRRETNCNTKSVTKRLKNEEVQHVCNTVKAACYACDTVLSVKILIFCIFS